MAIIRQYHLILTAVIVAFVAASDFNNSTDNSTISAHSVSKKNGSHEEVEHVSIHVVGWRWTYVKTPLILTAFTLITGILKIGFHHADFLSSVIPESCLLILLGAVVGGITIPLSPTFLPHFTTETFFLYLLPPIVLEASYSLHDRAFFKNLGTILLYAIIGTVLNCFMIGFSLFGMGKLDNGMLSLSIIEALVFSAIISAVDPVAVLAIFQEIGVNKDLYFLVFGESLLNDAVTIVLYGMMETFTKMPEIKPEQFGLGFASFLTLSLGGLFIGITIGVITSLITRFTEKVRVVEPLTFLGFAYFAYLFAELFHLSGIISLIGCGLVQAHYATKNISSKSYTTIKYFTKMLSSISDAIIFLILGMVLVEMDHDWHTGFVLATIALCLICRSIGVYFLTYISNMFRQKRINYEEQFIMAYGGLRGAVSFSLVVLLNEESVPQKSIFVTTTLAVVLFTVFFQGISIKPLVKILRITTRKKKKLSLFDEINDKVITHVMAGVEEISGNLGDFYLQELFHRYNNKYIKPILIKSSSSGNFNRLYEKVTLADHYANLYGPNICLEDRKPLIKVLKPDSKVDEVVSNMMASGPAIDLKPEVTELEVELRQPSRWKKVRNSIKRSMSLSHGTQPESTVTKVRATQHQLLHRALSNAPYEKFHWKNNKNLVDDDSQELSYHLQQRCSNAKKLTSIILSPPFTSDPTTQVDHTSPADQSVSSLPPDSRLDVYDITQLLIDRARMSKFRARSRSVSGRASRPPSRPAFSRALSLNDAITLEKPSPTLSSNGLTPVVEETKESELDENKETQI